MRFAPVFGGGAFRVTAGRSRVRYWALALGARAGEATACPLQRYEPALLTVDRWLSQALTNFAPNLQRALRQDFLLEADVRILCSIPAQTPVAAPYEWP